MKLKTEGLLSLIAERAACETRNAHPYYGGLVPLGPSFTRTGSFHGRLSIRVK